MGLELTVAGLRAGIDVLSKLPDSAMEKPAGFAPAPSEDAKKMTRESVTDPMRGAWIRSSSGAGRGTLLFFHGGGYAFGSVDSHLDFTAKLVLAGGFDVFSVDYRLTYESPYPAAVDDAVAAWRWLREQGIEASDLVVAGDSAGGGLSLALLLRLRELGEPMPKGAGLVSPWVDLESTRPSIQSNAATDYLARAPLDRWSRGYAGNALRSDPLLSPIHADLTGLPPMLIQIGTAEILHDEGIEFARKAEKAGVPIRLAEWPEMPHDWHLLSNVDPRGGEALRELAAYLRERLDAAS